MASYTIRYTIYSDISFKHLKEKVNAFFKENRFVVGEDPEDNLSTHEIISKWRNNDDKCYVVIYPSRMHYAYIGSGIGIALFNTHYTSAKETDEYLNISNESSEYDFKNEPEPPAEVINIPEPITKRFERNPNIIKIDSHKLWLDHGDITAHRIALYLGNKGYKTYMLGFSDELFFIKRSPIYSDEERVEQIMNYMEKFYFNMDTDGRVQDELKAVVGSKWDALDFRIKKFLTTGFFLFEL